MSPTTISDNISVGALSGTRADGGGGGAAGAGPGTGAPGGGGEKDPADPGDLAAALLDPEAEDARSAPDCATGGGTGVAAGESCV